MKSIINILNKYTNNLASIRVLAYFPELCYLELLMAIIGIIKVGVGKKCPWGHNYPAGLHAR